MIGLIKQAEVLVRLPYSTTLISGSTRIEEEPGRSSLIRLDT
jgi:hypothetical protein